MKTIIKDKIDPILFYCFVVIAIAIPILERQMGWNWSNEAVLIYELFAFFSIVIGVFRFFGCIGIMALSVLATVLANIECLISIDAFGIGMTGGNILFAITFLSTDIISEMYGKKQANKLVNMSIAISIAFLLFSQCWLLMKPNAADFVFPSIQSIFSNTPRLMIASLLTYAIVQKFDVWLYHKIWEWTEKKSDRKSYLWLRNNGSTMTSQLLNAIIFTFAAFLTFDGDAFDANIYGSTGWCINVAVSTYLIYVFTSLMDTPVIYICRNLKEKGKVKDFEIVSKQ